MHLAVMQYAGPNGQVGCYSGTVALKWSSHLSNCDLEEKGWKAPVIAGSGLFDGSPVTLLLLAAYIVAKGVFKKSGFQHRKGWMKLRDERSGA